MIEIRDEDAARAFELFRRNAQAVEPEATVALSIITNPFHVLPDAGAGYAVTVSGAFGDLRQPRTAFQKSATSFEDAMRRALQRLGLMPRPEGGHS